MKVTVDASRKVCKYEDPTRWQCSTLRYSPPEYFPAYMEKVIGRPLVHRAFITLDEYWDIKTDTYHPDYEIGVLRYPVEELHYPYDWAYIVPAPTGTRFEAYLSSHSKSSETIMLNVRRLEREVIDGVITFEKYGEVLENAILYSLSLAPNIRYIEVGNETNAKTFGLLTPEEFAKLYVYAHKVIEKINREHPEREPLLIGGISVAGALQNWSYHEKCLRLLAQTEIGDKPMDYYSLHHYDTNSSIRLILNGRADLGNLGGVEKLRVLMQRHHSLLRELGLPDAPVFLNEAGKCRATANPGDSLVNACGIVTYLIGAATGALGEMRVFPWCTFHNPEKQISYTQFTLREDGTYAATPNAYAIRMLHRISGDIVEYTVDSTYGPDIPYRAIAVRDGDELDVVAANPVDSVQSLTLDVHGLDDGEYAITFHTVDATQNNCVTGTGDGGPYLSCTRRGKFTVSGDKYSVTVPLRDNAFTLIRIKKVEAEPAEVRTSTDIIED